MADRAILKKSHRKGSLARRVLLTATILLVLPLFIHTSILYIREYKSDIATVKNLLKIAQGGRVELFQELIEEKGKILDYLSTHLDQIEVFEAEGIDPNSESDPIFTRIDPDQHLLWVGKNINETEAIGIPLQLDEWVSKWQYLKKFQYPIVISLKDQNGSLVAGDALDLKQKWITVQTEVPQAHLVLELSVPLLAIQRYEIGYYSFSVFTLVILIGLVGGGIAFVFTRRIAKPFEALCKTMERVSEGAVHARYSPDEMGFEINALGEQFNLTLDELLKRTEEAERERIDRERLAQELKIGREIQLSMLPKDLPPFPGLDLAPGYLAAQEVSGDFYDLFPIDSHRLLFVVADSAGKGIPACLYSLGFRSALRAFALEGSSISEIVRQANDLLILDTGDSGFFITAWVGILDTKTGKLEYCSQGHPPAILRRDGHLLELSTDGMALGVVEFSHPNMEEMVLRDGDFLLLYTDGVIEAHAPDRHLFSQKRLNDSILHFSKNTASEYVEDLLEEIRQFSHGQPQFDDITLLAINFEKK